MFAESTSTDTLNNTLSSPSSDCHSVRPMMDWPELKICDLTPRHESDVLSSSDLSSSCPDDNKLSLHDDEDVCSSMVEPGNITSTLDNSIESTRDSHICLPTPLCSLSLCATAKKDFVNPLIWDITLQVTSVYDHMARGFSNIVNQTAVCLRVVLI